jgi:hypothetical protein
MFWRRAIEPSADMRSVLPVVIEMVGTLLNPTEGITLSRKPSAFEVRR